MLTLNNDHSKDSPTQDKELLIVFLTANFGAALLIFSVVSTLGGSSFEESLGGNTTLSILLFGFSFFFSLALISLRKDQKNKGE
ncbi:MAG: hypothetical protein WCK52_05245 [Betaproteobacteria bacterium]|jgi:hypothetical protein